MARVEFPIELVLDMLAEAPARIAELTAGLTPAQLRAVPGPGEWPANEVLAHLRACADMWGGAITAILAEDHPNLRAINPRTWIKQTGYLELEFTPSLQAYTIQRSELIGKLRLLSQEDWLRSATVTGAGKLLEHSVFFYAQWLARHERPHLKQIKSIAEAMRE